jgi:uncharacterized protein (TIGR00369 family)
MSMLALLDRCRRKGDPGPLVANIPYARFLGIDARVEKDGLITVLEYRQTNVGNPAVPALHGGVVGALLETAAVLQLLWEHEAEVVPKIINITVDYLRPAGLRATYARGLITKQGRRIANVSVDAWQEDEARLIASADCHFLLPGGADSPSRPETT